MKTAVLRKGRSGSELFRAAAQLKRHWNNFMKATGIIINFAGLIAIIVFFVFYILNFHISTESFEAVRLIGGDNGPTTVFLTAKINHTFLIFPLLFLAAFAFNLYYFVRKKGSN